MTDHRAALVLLPQLDDDPPNQTGGAFDEWLRDAGWDADRVRSLLAASLGLAEPGEPVSPAALLDRFDLAAVPKTAWMLDPASLGPDHRRPTECPA